MTLEIKIPDVEIYSSRLLRYKYYELSNHLGNVLATVSDYKLGYDNNADDIANGYKPDVLTFSDYYPFGVKTSKFLNC